VVGPYLGLLWFHRSGFPDATSVSHLPFGMRLYGPAIVARLRLGWGIFGKSGEVGRNVVSICFCEEFLSVTEVWRGVRRGFRADLGENAAIYAQIRGNRPLLLPVWLQ
jgi:hypothetical protein